MLREHGDEVASVIRRRATQLNEPNRCATLLPLLAALPGPLALLEVGASAGSASCPTGTPTSTTATLASTPVRPGRCCGAGYGGRLPAPVPEVVWRAGLDLDPIDVHDQDAVGWLEALVPPDDAHPISRH